ncbi:hypothetical protein DVU_2589 [Nitratidesulfovibrio vulgaris str. Hildenborough]|uniref:Uncharacterized protein n=1 Tax=Nitratidesulfovibrio vulgaris (strain ATCC 29579 / DSM 644 / CCUG 34227 / NCIMB 8303 / VKM B-1760 / Hildenborough) TaxID=882 RepID=Q728L4_NITV2|nr:hypothetical protein DVU_2589 [Nitratidesulfovibrio vulgaris str. Hildenborough]
MYAGQYLFTGILFSGEGAWRRVHSDGEARRAVSPWHAARGL